MDKTLYITDLDGTLLNEQAELSEYTTNTLNRLINEGMNFSIATARTGATSFKLLKDIKLNQPLVLMNGVLIYDMESGHFVKKAVINDKALKQINNAIIKTGQAGLMYGFVGDQMTTYYKTLEIKPLREFVEERIQKFNKKFVKVNDFCDVDADIIYFTFLNTKENIIKIHNELKDISDIQCVYYPDIYSNDLFYLELTNIYASKYSGITYLRENYGYTKIIGFGDNLNDIPLFEACDEAYAVSNAKEEVKAAATAIIGANTEDGVVKWLERKWNEPINP